MIKYYIFTILEVFRLDKLAQPSFIYLGGIRLGLSSAYYKIRFK